MFRDIRKKKNEISEDEAKKLLVNQRRGVLAVSGDENYPYALPINYYFDESANKIYFHGAKAGHKMDSIKRNDKVCFTVVGEEVVKDVEWAPYVKSAIVFGRCYVIDDPCLKMEKLKEFAAKYYPDATSIEEEMKASATAAQMFEIEIEHISGKEVQER